MKKHNAGEINSTKHRKPFLLLYYEACLSKENAIKREKQLKTGFGRKYIKTRTSTRPYAKHMSAK